MPPELQRAQPIRAKVTDLMTSPVRSAARKKAILTIAKKHNISRKDAQFRQSIRIAQSQVRKGK